MWNPTAAELSALLPPAARTAKGNAIKMTHSGEQTRPFRDRSQRPLHSICHPERRGAASRFMCGHDVGKFTICYVQVAFERKRPETVTLKKHASKPGAAGLPVNPRRGLHTHRAVETTAVGVSTRHVKTRYVYAVTPATARCGGHGSLETETLYGLVLFYLGLESKPSTHLTPEPREFAQNFSAILKAISLSLRKNSNNNNTATCTAHSLCLPESSP